MRCDEIRQDRTDPSFRVTNNKHRMDDEDLAAILTSTSTDATTTSRAQLDEKHSQKSDLASSFLSTLSDDSLIDYITNNNDGNPSPAPTVTTTTEPEYTRGDYFHEKKARQDEQDQLLREQYRTNLGAEPPQIFQNCIIYINGYTVPGRLQLHEMIVLHGGKFLHHLSAKKKVTHIIASNLPLKKRLEFQNYKVVKPDWIVQSIAQGKLLPWQDFALLTNLDERQKKLPLLLPKKQDSKTIVDCNDPNFISSYFQNSRLHHLSTWKSDLRAKFLNEMDFTRTIEKTDPLTIFHFDFDCFFATVAYMYKDPQLKCDMDVDPIVVCHGNKNSDIASCNYVARKYGIKNGMWVSQAEKLCPANVKLITLPYNFEQFAKKSEIFYNVLKDSNFFDLILPMSIDEAICVMVLDPMSNREKLETICRDIRAKVFTETKGCSISVGCADSLILARLNLKKSKPNGAFILNSNELDSDFLNEFKPDDLPGVGYSIVSKLREKFSTSNLTLQDLKNESTLISLQDCVGQKLGLKIHLALQGKDDEESSKLIYDPESILERKSLSLEINWGVRFNEINQVDTFIDRCCQYLHEKLNDLEKLTPQITLKIMKRAPDAPIEPAKYLGMGRCVPFNKSSRLGTPTNELGIIATEVKSLYRIIGCPPNEVRGVSIQFNKLCSPSINQQPALKLPFVKLNAPPNNIQDKTNHEFKKRKISLETPTMRLISPPKKFDILTSFEEKFIENLPTQIGEELKKDLRIKKKIQQTKRKEIEEEITKRQDLVKNYKSHFFSENSLFEPIKFQNISNFKKISQMIMEWVDGTLREGGPHERDVKLFEKYLIRLCDSNRVHLVLRLSNLISNKLNVCPRRDNEERGFQEWERILMKLMVPILNRNKHTFQTVRKLDIDYDL
ncbi:hypothetical protein NCAS_0E02370 [Naumovozyma castellii]|uniref:DNA repair protein REV1 n=1 Tax=Naumovozyma castellii TaxID=27288 RepID=G0VFP0_NAUCA|nr:hypothetical protein NCAS_0E02370 [Naumovozyma castellii CBS 4309]CCC70307.1 hypothetical protein NCAS_0E02370 [Naumovozyma castellii CBS 4309]